MTTTAREQAKRQARELLEQHGIEKPQLETPPKEIGADLAFPCFPLARQYKKSPHDIARELQEKLEKQKPPLFEKIRAEGGYLNFYLSGKEYAKRVVKEILKGAYGPKPERGETIIVDYSSPNIAKPLHVGHLRSTIIGDSIARLLRHEGYRVIGDNHLGDWGTQFGKVIAAYKKWGDKERFEKEGVHYLLHLYTKFHEEAEKNPELEDEAREESRKLEEGDPENTRLWKMFVEASKKYLHEKIYKPLGIVFDVEIGESEYIRAGEEIVKKALEMRVAKEQEDGSVIIELEDEGLTPLIIRRSDGASLYQTRDLATIDYRTKKWNPEACLYVVSSEQEYYFKQLFAAARKLGYTTRLEHVQFGLLTLPEGKLSTRKGRIVLLEEIIEKVVEKARASIRKKTGREGDEETARIIGIGALKFADLSQSRIKNVTFDYDKITSFEGDTAPYIQYAGVRIKSIFRKEGIDRNELVNKVETASLDYKEKEEIELAKTLAMFPETVERAACEREPYILANHLLEVARAFNQFYNTVPVLKAGEKEKTDRLLLCLATLIVIEKGLELLGIRVPEQM